MNVCSIIWGFSICCAVFSATKAARQSWLANKRNKLFTPYPMMIWAEWGSSVIISFLSWFFLKGILEPSFWLFFFILVFWCIQMHCILQIIINRVSLIMVNQARAKRLRLAVFIIVVLINISVFLIWIPARLQISRTYVHINEVWDRTEKAIFAVVDAGLNCFFMWSVRTKLIAAGLTKYKSLFRFNMMMVCISLSLDIILIGSMSIGTGVIYIQFHPLVYLLKLHIELNLAELIAKVVRASNPLNTSQDAGGTLAACGQGRHGLSRHPTNLSGTTERGSRVPSALVNHKFDLAEQGFSHVNREVNHPPVRPDIVHEKSGDTTLQDIDGERSEADSTQELRRKHSIP
ncbi:uncharacterized protein JN550_003299 [Neoarthrinium moseri]|uniref:uncharacterized protein n=1 Tax=Neoarthrinium moseri TaxID=1658444 RepID=UPI001FDB4B64|nr:uncharacterized protein JN550_003299 [Neoarthrinium moseri]KAI1873046.1 hypothetical protein JN550_003299 [Neoarthrinium moseri]